MFASPNVDSVQDALSPAVCAPNQPGWTHQDLNNQVAHRCAQLRKAGAGPNSRIAIVTDTGLEGIATLLAVMRCGIAVPLNPNYHEAEFLQGFRFLKADYLWTHPVHPDARAAAGKAGIPLLEFDGDPEASSEPWTEPPPPPEAVALVMQTSGTEGQPKRVPLTHGNLQAGIRAIQQSMQLSSEDRFLCMAKLHHIAGLVLVMASVDAGSPIFCVPGLHKTAFLGWLEEFQPTWFWAAPAMLGELLRWMEAHPEHLSDGRYLGHRLRFIRSGSAPLPPDTLEKLEKIFGVPVLENYGMTEATPQITTSLLPPAVRKPGSAGVPFGPEVRIADERGTPMPVGTEGEIQIRGASVTHGYEDDPEANARVFIDGWFRTGDTGRFDSDGYLFLQGRIRDMINRGGEKVWPREVEEVLVAHPLVSEAVVFPMPHATLSEDVAAAVVANGPVNQAELRRFAAARLAGFKVPARIAIVEGIPKGPGGKPQRHKLAGLLGFAPKEAGHSPAPFVGPTTPIEERLAAIWSQVLGVERVGIHDDFFDLGGDSLAVSALFVEISETFQRGTRLADRLDFFDSPTIAAQARQLATALPAAPRALPPEASYVSPLHTDSMGKWQARTDRPPIFIVPWADSNGEYLMELARALGDEWPFCVLTNPDAADRAYSIEDLAGRLWNVMRTIQPEGPYVVAGHCFGGIVAYEIARQIQASGQVVRLAAIVDSPTPGYPGLIRHAHLFAAGAVFHFMQALRDRNTMERLEFAAGALWRHIRKHGQGQVERVAMDVGKGSDLRAMRMYRPQPQELPAMVLAAANHVQTGSPLDRRLGWRSLIHPSPQFAVIQGDHSSILSKGQVAELAEHLRTALGVPLTSG